MKNAVCLKCGKVRCQCNKTLLGSPPDIIVKPNDISNYWYLNFLSWAANSGVQVDGRLFSFLGHLYLVPMYMDRSERIVLQKAAQMGATIMMALRKFHTALYPEAWGFNMPVKVGFYFPDKSGITDMVSDRFEPMMWSCPDLQPYAKQTKKLLKRIGDSSIYYRYMEGKSSKDSAPLNSLLFDEVRLMRKADIDQAEERLSASPLKWIFAASTAGFPECFTADTKITSRNKRTLEIVAKPIASFHLEGYKDWQVLSYDGEDIVWKDIVGAKHSGVAPTVCVEFEDGNKIYSTKEHPFACLPEHHFGPIQWIPIAELATEANKDALYSPYSDIYLGKANKQFIKFCRPGLSYKKIKSVSLTGESADVFDIQVADTSCFFLSDGGVLVHNSDINQMFLESDQKWFHTICERCNHEQVMAMDFPNNVAEHKIGTRAGQVYYACMKCGEEIPDTQNGRYVAHGDPKHPVSGYHISQLISHFITPYKVMESYRTTANKKEFYNAKLGMPYVDEENRPLTLDGLENNVYGNILPMSEWGRVSGVTYMGIDQMMNLNYVFILEKRGDDRRVVWFEVIEDRDPFARCAELMEDFSVLVCVCDAEPNTNDALKFARYFNKRVFLAKKGKYENMVRWDDHWRPKKPQRKASKAEYYQYRVFLDTYQSIERTLTMVKEGRIKWPDPDSHIMTAMPPKGGMAMPAPILRTHAFPHLSCAVRETVVVNEDKQEFRYIWKMLGYDPHSLDALNYAITASNRRTFMFND